ncbi:hypothetical protein AAFF_G00251750 [Aldrovandia affinis]|uniref:Uncharacterized protein n=1 Tax=Aldrovandia affinis TaxID=143900 RepID=A0AAD7WTL2_9TELE|nr:hypothetical protein AAFF_G00251750 [Aldrovandia affinis]
MAAIRSPRVVTDAHRVRVRARALAREDTSSHMVPGPNMTESQWQGLAGITVSWHGGPSLPHRTPAAGKPTLHIVVQYGKRKQEEIGPKPVENMTKWKW